MPKGKRTKESIRQTLERTILRGLSCEWDAAATYLTPEQKAGFHKPLFRLSAMKSKLGYWSSEKNEICLSLDFVLNVPWDSVREVLHHEMAHQYADRVMQARHETPHGPLFQKACHLLRANPDASGHYTSLHERVYTEPHQTDDRIMLRIKKLMALSESANPHEAQSAMSKAHALLFKYNIQLLERNESRHFESVFIGTPKLRHPREEYFIASLLQDFYFIQGIWIPAYVTQKSKTGRVLEISGTPQNIRIASYVYDFIKQYIRTKWAAYNKDNTLNRYRQSDFAVGVIEGFRSKLESRKPVKPSAPAGRYPVTIEDPLLTKYFSHRYPNVHRFRKQSGGHKHVYNEGKKIGKRMVIYKGIHERGKKRTYLLE